MVRDQEGIVNTWMNLKIGAPINFPGRRADGGAEKTKDRAWETFVHSKGSHQRRTSHYTYELNLYPLSSKLSLVRN